MRFLRQRRREQARAAARGIPTPAPTVTCFVAQLGHETEESTELPDWSSAFVVEDPVGQDDKIDPPGHIEAVVNVVVVSVMTLVAVKTPPSARVTTVVTDVSVSVSVSISVSVSVCLSVRVIVSVTVSVSPPCILMKEPMFTRNPDPESQHPHALGPRPQQKEASIHGVS